MILNGMPLKDIRKRVEFMESESNFTNEWMKNEIPIQRTVNVSFAKNAWDIRVFLEEYSQNNNDMPLAHVIIEALRCLKAFGREWRTKADESNESKLLKAIANLEMLIKSQGSNDIKPVSEVIEEEYGISFGEDMLG